MEKIKTIGFDADDTLWVNEPYYQEIEKELCQLLNDFLPAKDISSELLKTEIDNIEKYGYGAKSFMLSMIETALRISNMKVPAETIDKIIILGKSLIEKPIELLDGIEMVLNNLKNSYRLIVATKGDLIDQQRKLNSSGLLHHFHHIEIMHDKNEAEYLKLIKHLNIKPEEFLMVGNSLKSDILPVLSIGSQAVHVPFHKTWEYEVVIEKESLKYKTVEKISDLLDILKLQTNGKN